MASCATKFSVQKRKYTKGFYFSSSYNKQEHPKINKNKTKTQVYFEDSQIIIATDQLDLAIVTKETTESNRRLTSQSNNRSKKVFQKLSHPILLTKLNTKISFGTKLKARQADPEATKKQKFLFITVSVLAALLLLFGLWELIMYLFYKTSILLIIAIIALALSAVFYLFMSTMADSEMIK